MTARSKITAASNDSSDFRVHATNSNCFNLVDDGTVESNESMTAMSIVQLRIHTHTHRGARKRPRPPYPTTHPPN